MEIEFTVSLVCSGQFVRGAKEHFDKNFGNWLPPEGPQIDDFRVKLVKGDKSMDVTEMLTEDEHNKLYTEYLAQCIEGDQ